MILSKCYHLTSSHGNALDWKIKKFIDSSVYQLWLVDEVVGKVAGVFATGGGYGNAGSGVELTQIPMLGSLAECGMILVPFPKSALGSENTGSRWCFYARSGGTRMEPNEIAETMRWKEVANMVISAWISNAVD